MDIGDIYEGYRAVEVCSIAEWCTVLMQKMDESNTYGVLDYSFETDSIYDFVTDMDCDEAMKLFIKRIPHYIYIYEM